MRDADLCLQPMTELARAIKDKELSPVDLIDGFLERIEKEDGRLNTYITLLKEEALTAAKKAERDIKNGEYRGPLHGIPIALKDEFATRGIRTTCGSKILRDYVPNFDATVVSRLKEAGTVLLGKLNMHEFAWGGTNDNPHYGPVRNPWNLKLIPGGSSGGSGAAIAASLCAGSLGSDTGGSIRIPAAFCGIVGLKPTYGRVSRYGVMPTAWTMDHVGPMTKTVADSALMLNVIAGQDPNDPTTSDLPIPDYSEKLTSDISDVRVGVPTNYFFDEIDQQISKAVRKAIEKLEDLGAKILELKLPYIEYAHTALFIINAAEPSSFHEKNLKKRPQDYGEDVRALLELGSFLLATHYLKAQRVRRLMIRMFAEAFKAIDVMITPTSPIFPFRIGEKTAKLNGKRIAPLGVLPRFTGPFNLTGAPTISIPCGFSTSNLPIGLQIAARPFEEATILRVAHAYERESPAAGKHPK